MNYPNPPENRIKTQRPLSYLEMDILGGGLHSMLWCKVKLPRATSWGLNSCSSRSPVTVGTPPPWDASLSHMLPPYHLLLTAQPPQARTWLSAAHGPAPRLQFYLHGCFSHIQEAACLPDSRLASATYAEKCVWPSLETGDFHGAGRRSST